MKTKYVAKRDSMGKQGKETANFPNTSTSGKQKEPSGQSSEGQEEGVFCCPTLETVDKTRSLSYYCTILNKNKADAVGMDDLDKLQHELETILSASVVRGRTLVTEVNNFNADDSRSDKTILVINNKKRKLNDSPRVAKSMKELSKLRDREVSAKVDSSMPSENETDNSGDMAGDSQQTESLPKNDIPNKFWASVEPYVGDIKEENIKDIEELIQSCDNDMTGVKIPPLGQHYTTKWADEDLGQEKQASAGRQVKTSPTSEPDTVSLLKRASNMCSDRAPGPFVQRLVSALMEEPSHDSFTSKLVDENDSTLYLGKLPLYHTTACFERRIRQELEVVGLLETENEETDEILSEIKKCDEELKIVASQNKEHLKRLLGEAKIEMKRQEIKNKIKALDTELIEMYRKISAARLKEIQLEPKEKEQAWKILKDRELLLKSLEAI